MADIKPFMFEPEYTAEELSLREMQSTASTEVDSDSTASEDSRLTDLQSWCHCNVCVLMPTVAESCCCNDLSTCQRYCADGNSCITEHADFAAVCLTRGVLKMVMRLMQDLRGHVRPSVTTNRKYRLVAYRAFTWWTQGKLGRRVRRVIPSCVVNCIRIKFPSLGETYTGFRSAAEVNEAWTI